MGANVGCVALMHDAKQTFLVIESHAASHKANEKASANGLKTPGLSVLAAATLAGLAHTAQQF